MDKKYVVVLNKRLSRILDTIIKDEEWNSVTGWVINTLEDYYT